MGQEQVGVPAHGVDHGRVVQPGRRRVGVGVEQQPCLGLDKGHRVEARLHEPPLADRIATADGQRLGGRQEIIPGPARLGIGDPGRVEQRFVKVDQRVGDLDGQRPGAALPLHALQHAGIKGFGLQVRVRLEKVGQVQQCPLLHSLAGGRSADDVGRCCQDRR